MNKVILMGRITEDADVRYAGNTARAKFTLAVPRPFNADKTDFIRCVDWHKPEWYQTYGKKGVKLAIEGRIQTGSYKKDDGSIVYTTEVVIENKEFAESKKNSPSQEPSTQTVPTNTWVNADALDDVGLPFN